MSAVDDLRKLLQDVVTPDLKALSERVTGLEKRFDEKFDAVDKKIDLTRELLVAQIKSLETRMEANQAMLLHALDIDRRLERVESERAQERRLAS